MEDMKLILCRAVAIIIDNFSAFSCFFCLLLQVDRTEIFRYTLHNSLLYSRTIARCQQTFNYKTVDLVSLCVFQSHQKGPYGVNFYALTPISSEMTDHGVRHHHMQSFQMKFMRTPRTGRSNSKMLCIILLLTGNLCPVHSKSILTYILLNFHGLLIFFSQFGTSILYIMIILEFLNFYLYFSWLDVNPLP